MAARYIIQKLSTFYCFWITAGVVTSNCTVYDLDGKNRNNVFECESPGIISCKVAANSFLLQWFIADPILPSTPVAALCSGTSCTSYNGFSGRYTYTYNSADGIANITIRNISSDDRGLKYKFNDGTLPQIFEPITKVFPDKITTSINLIDGTQNVAVSTDCTLLSKNITFVWQKTKNSSGSQPVPLTQDDVKHTEITNLYDTLCDSTNTCGKIIFSSTLMFIPGNSGDAYYLHCTVVVNDDNGPPNKTWISSKAYQFNLQYPTTVKHNDTTASIPTPTTGTKSKSKQSIGDFFEEYKFPAIAAGCCLFIIIITIIICVCYKRKQKSNGNATELGKM